MVVLNPSRCWASDASVRINCGLIYSNIYDLFRVRLNSELNYDKTINASTQASRVSPMDFENVADFCNKSVDRGQYNANEVFNVNGTNQSQHTGPAPRPVQSHHPLYSTNQIQQHNYEQSQDYAPPPGVTHNGISTYQPMLPQQNTIPYRCPNPDRNFSTGAPSLHDPNVEQNTYARD